MNPLRSHLTPARALALAALLGAPAGSAHARVTTEARIAGYRARRTDITLTGTAHDPGSYGAMTLRLGTQWWMSTQAPGAAEIERFDRGFEKATRGLSPDAPGLLAGLPGAQDAMERL